MEKYRIYKLWWQGMENAPDIVKVCHESLLKNYNSQTQEIICLDENNIFDYVEFPDYILKKFQEGKINITHLSDIARTLLLGKTGGLWTDATMFFARTIANELFERDFFTVKNPSARTDSITSRWECFFIAGKRDFPLFSLLKDIWFEYWRREDELIDYLLIDHLFYIGYMENKRIREAIDSCPTFHYRIDHFQRLMNKEFDEKEFNEIINNEMYIKLTYKGVLQATTENGKMTFYGKLLKDYLK